MDDNEISGKNFLATLESGLQGLISKQLVEIVILKPHSHEKLLSKDLGQVVLFHLVS